ncbi:MAG: heat-inducible transcriptional repressor HrcA, partial [Actinobacteria bacterium]|nr:heat-inducible transcriptional repressor HrcA [Actinomycetota bacterium]
DVVNRTVRLLAQVTKQVAIVQYPSLSKSAVRHIEILPLTPLRLMIVLITDTGRVEQRIVELANQMNEVQVAQLRSQLNLICAGEKLNQIPITLKSFTDKFEVAERVNVTSVVNVILEMAIERSEEKVIVSGTANLARIPSDFATSFHPILEALEEQVVLLHLLGETADGTQVKIGHEQDNANLQSTSIVTSGYGPEGERVANLGIIGPTRMDYSGSMSAVSAVARYVSRFLEEGF